MKLAVGFAASVILLFGLLLAEGSYQRKKNLATFAEICERNGGEYSRCHDPEVYDEMQDAALKLEPSPGERR